MRRYLNKNHLHSLVELLLDGGDVHRVLDDLPVGGELLAVDRVDEGPALFVAPQLRQQGLADTQVLVNLKEHKLKVETGCDL